MGLRVVVIGAGVAGAATAFALARRAVDVVLVDADDPGTATAAGAGIIQPWSSADGSPLSDLSRAAADFYPTTLALLTDAGVDDVGFRSTGSLLVNADADRLDEAERRARIAAEDSVTAGSITRLDSPAAHALFPPLAPEMGAVHIGGGARVDGRLLRAGLIAAAEFHGASVRSGHAALRRTGDSIQVAVDGRRVPADVVIVAAGAWSGPLMEQVGLRLPVAPQRGQIVHLRLVDTDTAAWPTVHPLTSHYLVAFDDSRVVVGATRETGSGFDVRVTAAGQREVLAEALAVAPGLADATLLETRVGLRPVSDDGLPHLGPVEGIPALWLVTGYGANGLTLAPYVADLVARSVCDGRVDPALRPFAPRL